MSRSFSPSDLIALPRLNAISTARLLYELLKATTEEKKLPASIAADRDELAEAHHTLMAALKKRLVTELGESPQVRAADAVEDNAFGALFDWLRSFARLPEDRHPEALEARAVLQAVFPTNLGFLSISPPDEWQEAETRLQAIADNGYDVTIKKLGGGPFLEELKTAHKVYGEILGITVTRPTTEPLALREAFDAAHEALRSYVLRVSAHVRKSDPSSAELASRLLSPLVHWKDRPNKPSEPEEAPLPEAPANEPDGPLASG
jgi:hypothetical protein